MKHEKIRGRLFRTLIRALFLTAAMCAGALAGVSMTVAVSPDSATVGDVITMSVALKAPKGTQIIPPETNKGFGNFTVLSTADGVVAGLDRDTVKYQYNLTVFKPQNCTIPSVNFLVKIGDTLSIGADTLRASLFDTLSTPPIPIRIISVLPADISDDSVLAIRDLKPLQKTGAGGLASLWVLLAIVAAALIYYFLEKHAKKKAALEPPTVITIPPYEEAVRAIETLEGKNYLTTGRVREYSFELSEIFKRYIGRRYDTIASELTTEEIAAWLEYSGISREMRLCAERFFRTSDQVKFAKWKPDQKTIDSFMEDVRTFLEATKPEPILQYELKTERLGAIE